MAEFGVFVNRQPLMAVPELVRPAPHVLNRFGVEPEATLAQLGNVRPAFSSAFVAPSSPQSVAKTMPPDATILLYTWPLDEERVAAS